MAGNIVGKATMPIYPTMNGFRSAVLKETKAIGRTGGNTFAKAFGDGGGKQLGSKLKAGFDQAAGDLGAKALKGYQNDVAAASHGASTAMLNQKAAANQVKAAEEALAKAIAKHGENSTQAEAAQIRLEKANLRLADANGKAETATMRLRDSQKALTEAQAQASASAERTAASISGSFRNLGKTAMQPLSTAVTTIGQRLNAVTGPVKAVGAKITGTFVAARDKTVQAFTGLQTRAGGILTGIGNGAKTAFNHLPAGAQNALRSTGGYLSNLGSAAGQAFGALGNGARTAFSSLGSHARNAATTIGTHLKTAADNAYASLEHVASVSMAGLAAGAAAVGAKLVSVGKQAFSLYASYEQAVGGIDTLFKESSATVQKYAAQAYKTAGVDANTYMEQITSFSASLISSLGGDTAKAAELGNTAMIDMSDNANKMGTSIESIQQTYQSLARGNYAMLDNLKLGYGGTKTEMQRLIADANKVRAAHGEMADLSIDKFSDVVTAIHTIQNELGITGTTAKEASTTIEGSINSMKAAWTNWLTGLGRNDVDMGQMTDQLVAAISDVIKNAAPRIKQIASSLVKSLPKMFSSLTTLLPEPFQRAFDGIGQTIGKFKSIIAPAFAAFGAIGLKGLAPLLSNIPMLGGLFSKLAAPISALGGPITAIIAAIGALIATSPQLRSQFAATFAQVGKVLGDTVNMMMPSIKALGESFGQMLQAVMPALQELASTVIVLVFDLITTTAPLIKQLMVPLSAMLRQMMPIIGQVVTVLANAASSVLPPIVGVIEQILPSLASLIEQLIPLVPAILQPLMDIIVTLVPVIQQIVAAVAPVAAELLPMLIDAFSQLIPPVTEIINAILPTLVSIMQALAPIVTDVIGAIMSVVRALLPVVQGVINAIVGLINWVMGIVRGCLQIVQNVITAVGNVVRPLAGVIKGVVDVIAGIFTGDWNRVWSGISGIVRNAIDAVKNILSGAADIGRHFVEGIWNGISAAGGWLWQQVSGFFGNLKKNVLGFFGIHSPSRWFRDKVGKMLIKGLAVGIDQESGTAYRQMDTVSRELSRHATVGAKYSAAYQTAANPRNGYMDNSTHITQQFATKVVRSDADLYSASSILMRNALHEGRIYAR